MSGQSGQLQFWHPVGSGEPDWRNRWMGVRIQQWLEQALDGTWADSAHYIHPPEFEYEANGERLKSRDVNFTHTELFLRLTRLPIKEQTAFYKMAYELLWSSGEKFVEIEVYWSRRFGKNPQIRKVRVEGKYDIALSLV